jgi:hypothetical protein
MARIGSGRSGRRKPTDGLHTREKFAKMGALREVARRSSVGRGAALSLVLLALARAPRPALLDDEKEARELLADAEFQARKGRPGLASKRYREIAKKFPLTEAGKVATRRGQPSAFLGWDDLVRHGPSENRCDVVLMGDGYTLDHLDLFANLAAAIPPLFEAQPEYREYWEYFNFQQAIVVSADDGVDEYGRKYDTALGGHRSGMIQGQVAVDEGRVHAMLAEMPASDHIAIVFVKLGLLGTGGGGIACIGGRDNATLIHEFGHAFADLGDEYTSNTGHRGAVSNSPNVSNSDDPKKVPWAHWLAAKVPGIGVYEGANGQVHNAWKPTTRSCVMASGNFYCAPCREALTLRIYRDVDPIDGCTPAAIPSDDARSISGLESFDFEVQVLRPATHALDVRWWVLPETGAPKSPPGWEQGTQGRDRRQRGPLPTIEQAPTKEDLSHDMTKHAFTVVAKTLKPGRYRVICRVNDDARPRTEKYPIVLKDSDGLLEGERAWWIRVDPPPAKK